MKICARNQIFSKVLEVHKGATTSRVIIKAAGAQIFTSVTNDADAEPGLR